MQCLSAFKLFGDMPTLAILYFLSDQHKRFNELERLTHMNPVTLTSRLKRLVEQGIVVRTTKDQDAQSVTYTLSNLGRQGLPILQQIEAFSRQMPQ